ncbi:Superkiller protein 3 [Coemansia asiatica]|uniref:Superkiller protein 3 n=1 Tax=Coemansia asiatica TaxID=1052880 RepID=A0A9W7XRP6_9FUNG|nr:Superkiller protein 3 [Coemansia asiatica]
MSVIFKAKLKSAKAAVADRDYEYAYDLCQDLLELDAENYNVYIFLGVACQHLGKWTEGETAYEKAKSMPKANILAWQGASALQEASGDKSKYKRALEELRDRYIKEDDPEKAWETMYKVIEMVEKSGDRRRLVSELRQLTEGGKMHALLSAGMTEPEVPTEREVLERMYAVESNLDSQTIESEIEKRRTRLSAGPIGRVRHQVKSEVWGQSGLLATLSRLVALHLDDEERFDWEERYFEELRQRAPIVDDAKERAEMADEAVQVARDLANNGRCASAFEFLLDSGICSGSIKDREIRELCASYLQVFGEHSLAPAAQVLLDADDSGAVEQKKHRLQLAEEAQRRAPDSPFAQVQFLLAAFDAREFRTAADFGSLARTTVNEFAAINAGVSSSHGLFVIDLAVADAYLKVGPEHAADAEVLYRRCLVARPGDPRATLGLGLALCALGSFGESRQLLQAALDSDSSNHMALGGLGAVMLEEGDATGAAQTLERAVALDPSCAQYHSDLGWAYWRTGGDKQTDKSFAFSNWLAAARLDSSSTKTFGGLAKWYTQAGDAVRARRCLEKAVSLDAANSDAGETLARIYAQEGRDDLLQILLERATEAQRSQGWAWRMLGLLHLRLGAGEPAVLAFRSALAADRADVRSWEGMCEAYMAVGRTSAAVRVAARVIELSPDQVGGHWLGARAALMAGDPEAALSHLEAALALGDDAWADALAVARAETLAACAARWHSRGLFARVADAGAEALKTLENAQHPSFLIWGIAFSACVWIARGLKLFVAGCEGDSTRGVDAMRKLIARARAEEKALTVPRFLRETLDIANGAREDDRADGFASLVFELAERCARLRILLAPSLAHASSAWADLGHVYCERDATMHPLLLGRQIEGPRPLLDGAGRCARAAVQLDDDSVRAYLLQGVVATWSGDAMLAQHAFIKASRRSPHSAQPWASLGFLYMHFNDIDLASRAFSRALALDPEHVGARLGAAVAAEKTQSPACVDLFEACLQAPDAARAIADYGFAKQVWLGAARRGSSHRSFSEQSRLALAIYAARRYVARTSDPRGEGAHLLGLLLEQNAEWEAAADAYACHVAKTSSDQRKWVALVHLARAQCGAGQFAQSTETYALVRHLKQPNDPLRIFFCTLGHSLALFFAQRLEESLAHFEIALEQAEAAPRQRAFVAVMLGQVLWALGSAEHRRLARQHLIDVMSQSDAQLSVLPGLTTLFAIGLLQDDADLIAATYPELLKHRNADPLHNIVRLESYLALLREDTAAARRAVSKALYRSPADASLWLLASHIDLLAGHAGDAAESARGALQLFTYAARGHFSSWSVAPPLALVNSAKLQVAVDACTVEARALRISGSCGKSAKSAANKAVMLQPWVPDTWALLD